MTEMNKVCRLASRPVGMPKSSDFEIVSARVGTVGDGQIRVRNSHISLDPAMRGWVAEGKSYVPPVAIGEEMRAITVGTVEESKNDKFKVGQTVVGLFGVQEVAISDGKGAYAVDTNLAPAPKWLGGLGMPGITGYFGILDVASVKEGDVVVVSAASGAVGSIVGQIAKLKGAKAIGIAGGPKKCAYVVDELGFDGCVDYKAGNLYKDLKAACPDGIDVYFENVGGDILDTVLAQMNVFGRIAVCGMIANYNATEPVPGPYNMRSILVNRLTVRGLIVFDFLDRYPEALGNLGKWYAEGKIKINEDIRKGGIDMFPETLTELYTGGNFGKLVLQV